MEDRLNSTCTQLRRESNVCESDSGARPVWNLLVVTITIILVVLAILTSFGNFLVCRTVWVCRRLQIPPFYFLTSLSFSDFLVGLLVIPLSLAYHVTYQTSGRWIFGRFTCNLWLYLNFILCIASIFNLCAVSGDRYLAVTSPLSYLSRMNSRTVKRVVALSWFCALFLAGFIVYGLNASTDLGAYCAVWGLRFRFVMVVLVGGYILPVMFLVFANVKVFCIARSHATRIHAQETSLAVISAPKTLTKNGRVRSQQSRLKQEIKIFKTFLVVTLTFLLSWTPFIVILVLDSLAPVPATIRHSSIIILYSNSAMNPFIYGFFNSEFRKALLETFKCKCKRRVGNVTAHVQKETKEQTGS